jgi:hypothetical protein
MSAFVINHIALSDETPAAKLASKGFLTSMAHDMMFKACWLSEYLGASWKFALGR